MADVSNVWWAAFILVCTGGIFEQFKDAVVTPSLAEIISMEMAVYLNYIHTGYAAIKK